MATETVVRTLANKKTSTRIELDALMPVLELAQEIRRKHSRER